MTELDSASSSKEKLLSEYISARQELFRALTGLTSSDLGQMIDDNWTVKDVVAHIVAWDSNAIDNAGFLIRGETKKVRTHDEDDFNRAAVGKYKDFSDEVVVGELHRVTDEVTDFLRTVDEGELFKDRVVNGGSITASKGFRYAHHDIAHANQILEWRRQKGI